MSARRRKTGLRTKWRTCVVLIRNPLPLLPPVACGDRVVKAGRCSEHYADWKHAKEARRGQPMVVTHASPIKKHGTGTSASAIQNRKDRAARIAKRRAA